MILIVRPEPGASETAARARELSLCAETAPLFEILPVPWRVEGIVEAVAMTSANAARHGGDALAPLTHLPLFAVGEATARAAVEAGFCDVRQGGGDVAALAQILRDEGLVTLHLAGADHIAIDAPDVRPCVTYRTIALTPRLPDQALVLLHSARAAARFAGLAGDRLRYRIVAISPRAAEAVGRGWRDVVVAATPTDAAMLELARTMCETQS